MRPFGFKKGERLCSKKSIDSIFSEGRSVFNYPLKAAYIIEPKSADQPAVQVVFIVPKKKVKLAVHRNSIRRRVREAYRLNKHLLVSWCLDNNFQLRIALIYVASTSLKYDQIQVSTQRIIEMLMQHKTS